MLSPKQRLLIFMPHITWRAVSAISYENLWDKAGFSGTETAFMEIGKILVDSGRFDVTVVGYSGNTPTYVDPESGIRFQQWCTLESDSVNDYDWYCPLFYVFAPQHTQIMRQIRDKQKTKVVVWLQCFLDNDAVLHQWRQEQYQVYAMAVSQWVFEKYTTILDTDHLWLVPNGVAPRFHQNAPPGQKERGMWCFHPQFSRGGSVATRVFEQVHRRCPDAARSFQTMSYDTTDNRKPMPAFVHCHGSLSKSQVAAVLDKSEYFVYPLVHPHGAVHHDTFGCVILEALAMGVIVVTWNVACNPQLYGDYVVSLPPPATYPANDRWVDDPWFLSDEAVTQFADAVVALEADPGRKAELRRRGIEWARQQTWDIGANTMLARMSPPLPSHATRECGSSFLDLESYDRAQLRERFLAAAAAEPFQHLVLDDFLNPALLAAAERELRDQDDDTPMVRQALQELRSAPFLQFLSDVTGIEAGNKFGAAAGVHRAQHGSPLMHADFRRPTALLYLNSDWEPAHQGQLEVWAKEECIHSLPPIFNRLVLFRITKDDTNVHPQPWLGPPGTMDQLAFALRFCADDDDDNA